MNAVVNKKGAHRVRRKGSSEDAGREQPQGHEAEQKPVDVGVEVTDVEGAGTEAAEADKSGETADNQAGEKDLLEEINKEGEALLNLSDVVTVSTVEGVPESRERREEAGDFVGEGIGGSGFVEKVADAGTDSHQEVPHLHVHLFAGQPLGPMLVR